MDLFLREAVDRIGVDDALAKIDALMDWSSFSPILKRGLGRSGVGPQGYDPLVLFCPSSYKMGHQSVLSLGGSGSSLGLIMQPAFDVASGDIGLSVS